MNYVLSALRRAHVTAASKTLRAIDSVNCTKRWGLANCSLSLLSCSWITSCKAQCYLQTNLRNKNIECKNLLQITEFAHEVFPGSFFYFFKLPSSEGPSVPMRRSKCPEPDGYSTMFGFHLVKEEALLAHLRFSSNVALCSLYIFCIAVHVSYYW